MNFYRTSSFTLSFALCLCKRTGLFPFDSVTSAELNAPRIVPVKLKWLRTCIPLGYQSFVIPAQLRCLLLEFKIKMKTSDPTRC